MSSLLALRLSLARRPGSCSVAPSAVSPWLCRACCSGENEARPGGVLLVCYGLTDQQMKRLTPWISLTGESVTAEAGVGIGAGKVKVYSGGVFGGRADGLRAGGRSLRATRRSCYRRERCADFPL